MRHEAGFQSPLVVASAARNSEEPPLAMVVLRDDVPTHERNPPHGVAVSDPLEKHPIPKGSVLVGPVTSRQQASEHLKDGVGWLLGVDHRGVRSPAPVVTGQHYDGSPRLAIIGEIFMPPPETPLAKSMEVYQ
jgi:hypothetical protein